MPYHVKVKAVSVGKKMRQAMRRLPRATHDFAVWSMHKADPYVPYHSGALTRSAHVEDGVRVVRYGAKKKLASPETRYGSSVIYDTPYAHHTYLGLKAAYTDQDAKVIHGVLKKKAYAESGDSMKLHFSKKVHPKAQAYWFFGAQMDHLQEYEAKMKELVMREMKHL